MASRIEDYALIGNSQSAALVGRDGSIDWLCLPRFDSPSCFSALLGNSDHGRWKIAPPGWGAQASRRYLPGTLVLESIYRDPGGASARVLDCMIPGIHTPILVRSVEGLEGRMTFEMELVLRFDYGSTVPWVRKMSNGHISGLVAIAGPDTVRIQSPIPMRGADFRTYARFEVTAGKTAPFVLSWTPSHEEASLEELEIARDPCAAIARATRWGQDWSSRSTYQGEWKEAVERSLLTLKALTHERTGGIVAAPTTSLPERIGGVRNWDYRFCWLRDATFTLDALASAGYREEARAWRDWLLRAVAGKPSDLRILYGVAGERRTTELELPWLPGHRGSKPVRIGNDAHQQLQLDVYGEVLDAFHYALTLDAREERDDQHGLGKQSHGTRVDHGDADGHGWRVLRKLINYVEVAWDRPDSGIWEVRGPPRHFTHSKVMAWVALERGIDLIRRARLDGPIDRWLALRDRIHAEVCARGFNPEKGAFTQYFGSRELDASLLLLPIVGFLPATEPRMRATIEAIGRELSVDGFIRRYRTEQGQAVGVDGLPPGEGAFLACTFWYADDLLLMGRTREARDIFERLLAIRNDVGLLPEEYDPGTGRFAGNFPQAFSHVALVNFACNYAKAAGIPRRSEPAA